jgi:hypothetical protein
MPVSCLKAAAVHHCDYEAELTIAPREHDLACACRLHWLFHLSCVVHAWVELLDHQDWVLLLPKCDDDLTRGQAEFRFA